MCTWAVMLAENWASDSFSESPFREGMREAAAATGFSRRKSTVMLVATPGWRTLTTTWRRFPFSCITALCTCVPAARPLMEDGCRYRVILSKNRSVQSGRFPVPLSDF